MSIASRKEREFKNREDLILKTAFKMLFDDGYIGLTIDKLAKKIDYAKGTVYKHFSCKEDIIAKILNDSFVERGKIIERVLPFDLPARAKFYAGSVGAVLYNILNPNLHKLMMTARVGSIWSKVSDELKEEHNCRISASYNAIENLVQVAVANGDLELGEHESADIFFTFISICIGYDGLIKGQMCSDMPPSMYDCFKNTKIITDPKKLLALNINTYLDGLNWRPLSSEFDYNALDEELRNTVYADLVEKEEKGLFNEYIQI